MNKRNKHQKMKAGEWKFLYENVDGIKFYIRWNENKHEGEILLRSSIHCDAVELIDPDTGQQINKEELLKAIDADDFEVEKIWTKTDLFNRTKDIFYVMLQDKEITSSEFEKIMSDLNAAWNIL
jgi:hypothetical protein